MASVSSSKTIFLYNGAGASPDCVAETQKFLRSTCGKYSVIPVDFSYMKREAPPALYVFPGGKAMMMGFEIVSSAEKIKQSVRQGSGLLAFCSGAMVVSSQWNYRVPIKEAPFTAGMTSFDFDQPLLLGPAAYAPTFVDVICESKDMLEELRPRNAKIESATLGDFRCFWSNGPLFGKLKAEDVVVASYQSDPSLNPLLTRIEPLAAVVHRPSSGSCGSIVLSGIHPEMAEWAHRNGHPLTDSDIESNRRLFKECCQRAGIETDPKSCE